VNRYNNTNIKLDKDGKRVYSTTYYPEIPLSNSDKFINTTERVRLDILANNHYGDTTLWWVIAKANGIKGINVLKVGTLLRIPGNVTKIIRDFRELNS
tara:strand:+ start:45 stop:338 length:294 start_codon:yes stop_codon:yes gene_type:complete